MKPRFGLILFLFLIFFNCPYENESSAQEAVSVDFTMAERAVDWLEFINTDPGDEAIRDYFFKNVVPTRGCQSIIKHWGRFMKWDNEEFYKFLMEALDRIPTDRPLVNEDGSLSGLGKRRMLWMAALDNPQSIRTDIEKLKKMNLVDTSLTLARMYLPENARIDNSFYFQLFGGSNAYSIGEENGFDILQLYKTNDGTIDVQQVILLLAHEMHHTGFVSCEKVETGDNLLLLGVLAAEGMPTHFIDRTMDKIEVYKSGHDKILKDLAVQWESHLQRLPQIYIEAEQDIQLNLEGKIGQKEIWAKWMNGLQGQAYALGGDMFSVIDRYLGVDSARIVPADTRQFLRIYNTAAQIGNSQGGNYYVFKDELISRVTNH